MSSQERTDAGEPERTITVDYGLTLEEMIHAGRYHRVDPNITAANFPIQGSGLVELRAVLLDLKKYITTQEAESEIARRGLRPARLEELLAFGAAGWDRHAIALGSSLKSPAGQRRVPAILIYPDTEYSDEHRDLELTAADPKEQWLGVPFLAVHAAA